MIKGKEINTMPYSQSGALGRRVAFWDCLVNNLQEVIKDTDNETANKWPDDKDISAMNNILAMLRMIQIIALGRFQEVLGDKINELQDLPIKENDNS